VTSTYICTGNDESPGFSQAAGDTALLGWRDTLKPGGSGSPSSCGVSTNPSNFSEATQQRAKAWPHSAFAGVDRGRLWCVACLPGTEQLGSNTFPSL
jgi:hypothetical protein